MEIGTNYAIMNKMIRKTITILSLMIFAVNMITVTAWAKPCDFTAEPAKIEKAAEQMPCHEGMEDEQQMPAKDGHHCKGLCLCKHAQFSPNVTVPDYLAISYFAPEQGIDLAAAQELIPLTVSPLKRPPRA